jgi:hypothetical protein
LSLAVANLLKKAFVRSWLPTYSNAFEPKQLAMLMVEEPPNNKCQKNASNGKTLPTTAVSL